MFERIIGRLFRGFHYWRRVSFDEIAELYTSRLLTIFAANIVNLFAAVYLYKLGYSVLFIALFHAAMYALKVVFSYAGARYIAYYGPKHGALLGNLLRIPALISFALVPVAGQHMTLAIIVFGIFQNLAVMLYDMSYLTNFSKVRSTEHTGKEIGVMQQVEKAARVISPIVGGAIATLWTPEVSIIVAGVLFAIAAVPLFRSVEPTSTRTPLKWRGFPWRLALPSLVAEAALGFNFVASGMGWTLFVTIFVFGAFGEGIYATLGGIMSLGVLISMGSAWIFGKIIDRRRGDVLLTGGVMVNMVLHALRPTIAAPTGVVLMNVANETATSAYSMPMLRVIFDIADSSGFRIAYVMYIEMALNAGVALGCLSLAILVMTLGAHSGFVALFIATAPVALILLFVRRAAR